jgi:hypothetical protein
LVKAEELGQTWDKRFGREYAEASDDSSRRIWEVRECGHRLQGDGRAKSRGDGAKNDASHNGILESDLWAGMGPMGHRLEADQPLAGDAKKRIMADMSFLWSENGLALILLAGILIRFMTLPYRQRGSMASAVIWSVNAVLLVILLPLIRELTGASGRSGGAFLIKDRQAVTTLSFVLAALSATRLRRSKAFFFPSLITGVILLAAMIWSSAIAY